MIVLINPHQKTVTICGESIQVLSVTDIENLEYYLNGNEVIYVTEYIETSGEEVVDIIKNTYIDTDTMGDQTQIDSGILYLHTTGKSKVYVNYKNRDYLFSGIYDFKEVADLPDSFLDDCKIVRDGIKSGLFEVVDEYTKKTLEKKKADDHTLIENKRKATADIKGSVDDPIEIDLGGKVSFKRNNK